MEVCLPALFWTNQLLGAGSSVFVIVATIFLYDVFIRVAH